MAEKKKKNSGRWGLMIILIAAILICGFIIWKTMEIHDDKEAAEQVLSTIKENIEDVKRDNEHLEEEIKYRQTNDYIEDEARSKLGLVGADETHFKEGDPEKNKANTDESND